jgi:xylose isomerase
MDTFARALLTAQAILDDGTYTSLRKERYASFDSGKGKSFAQGKVGLEDLVSLANKNGEPKQISCQQPPHAAASSSLTPR